jgi:signal transduction histidine kinase/CheY-like chemotaxis protein
VIYFAGKIHSSVEPWKRVCRILAPIVLPLIALVCQEIFWDHIRSQKFLFFYPAVMASGWIAGKRGSLFATVFSSVAVFHFLMESNRLTSTLSHDEYIPLFVFVAIGLLISHYLTVEERVITQLALQTVELEEANQARISFLAHVSHEIRTPLNAILGYAQLLEEDLREAPQRAMTQRIQSAGEYLLSILNKILDFKKIEAHLLKLDPQTQDLCEFLKEIQHTVEPSADAKGISFRMECAEVQGLFLSFDSLRFKQILLNLCTNAIKFTEKGQVTLRVRILEDRESDLLILFEIQDTGIGISDDGLKVLFKPFMQEDASIAGRFGGSGLGLSIVKQLVEMMGGQVGVQSRLGHGTLFWLEIPFERGSLTDTPRIHRPRAHDTHGKRLLGLRVLAADDNPINLELVAGIIRREGGEIQTASNGSEVLHLMERSSNQFDVILMDLHMPHLNGIEATRKIRTKPEWRHMPVVCYSAEALEITKDADAITLFDGWIEKPIRVDHAIETLAKFGSPPVFPNENELVSDNNEREISVSAPALTNDSLPPMVHAERVAALFGADIETFYNCFSQFQRVFASAGRELEDALTSGSDVLAKDLLHNIRGSAANLGLSGLAERAGQIESMLAAHHTKEMVQDAVIPFIHALQDVLDVRYVQSSYSPSIDSTLGQSARDEDLTELAMLLADSNLKALSISSSLQHYFKHDLGEIALRELNYALEGLEFDKAIKILSHAYGARLLNRRQPEEKL